MLLAARAAAAPSRREQVSSLGLAAPSPPSPGPRCARSHSAPSPEQLGVGDLLQAARSGGRFGILCSELLREKEKIGDTRGSAVVRGRRIVRSAFRGRVGALVLLRESGVLTQTRTVGKETHNLL